MVAPLAEISLAPLAGILLRPWQWNLVFGGS